MAEGLVARMKRELGREDTTVIATGGLASIVADSTDAFDVVDGQLTIKGYLRNLPPHAGASVGSGEVETLQTANPYGLGRKLLLAGIGLDGRAAPDVQARKHTDRKRQAVGRHRRNLATEQRHHVEKYSPSTGASGPAAPCGVLATTSPGVHTGQHGDGQRLDQRFVSYVPPSSLNAERSISTVTAPNMPAAPAPPLTATRANDVSNAGAPHTMSLGH